MLFCPSFTQSARDLQTDQLITRLQVVVMINFIRMLTGNVIVNVFKSDLVGSDLPHSPSPKLNSLPEEKKEKNTDPWR